MSRPRSHGRGWRRERRILRATLSREGGRWYVSFTCEVERGPQAPRFPDAIVGADAGVRHPAVLSTGERVPNPRPLERALRKLARLNRELARRQRGNERREKTRKRLARLHARGANIPGRHAPAHRPRTYGTVVVERLSVAGLLRNRRLSRALADTGRAEPRHQLAQRTVWYGSRLVEADSFHPGSRRARVWER